MVQCKKYPVSESASLDPLAPIHIFQHQFPGKGEIFFHFFFKMSNHLMGIFLYFMVVGCAAWAEKWKKVKKCGIYDGKRMIIKT